jgi:hypothetical protein
MRWIVEIGDEFKTEFDDLPEAVRRATGQNTPSSTIRATIGTADCRHPEWNMKELRFNVSDGIWRAAFAFDPKRKAVVLVAGDKSGGSEKRFYEQLIRKADARFGAHLARLETQQSKASKEKNRTKGK